MIYFEMVIHVEYFNCYSYTALGAFALRTGIRVVVRDKANRTYKYYYISQLCVTFGS